VAGQAHRLKPHRVHPLNFELIRLREYASVFCENPGCVLHVKPGDVNVEGNGNWVETREGLIIGRQRVQAVMLCDQCVARVLRGELEVRRDCAA
jgi:hypothetical protein